MRSIMEIISGDDSKRHLRVYPKEIAACLKDILSESVTTREARLRHSAFDERKLLEEHLRDVVRTEYDCTVSVYGSGGVPEPEDPKRKARLARAYHPAIYIE